jgi:hypothetical protein
MTVGKWLIGGLILSGIALLTTGCNQPSQRYYMALQHVDVDLPPRTAELVKRPRATPHSEKLRVYPGGQKTLLIVGHEKQEADAFGDPWWNTYVIVLDEPLRLGRHEVTPENGRLIQETEILPAKEPYRGLEGRATIEEIEPGELDVDLAVRSIIRHVDHDKLYVVRGSYDFLILRGDEPILDRFNIEMDAGPESIPVDGDNPSDRSGQNRPEEIP